MRTECANLHGGLASLYLSLLVPRPCWMRIVSTFLTSLYLYLLVPALPLRPKCANKTHALVHTKLHGACCMCSMSTVFFFPPLQAALRLSASSGIHRRSARNKLCPKKWSFSSSGLPQEMLTVRCLAELLILAVSTYPHLSMDMFPLGLVSLCTDTLPVQC